MSSPDNVERRMRAREPEIAVYGATGQVGRRICRALAHAGVRFAIAGRRGSALDEVAADGAAATTHVAAAGDRDALVRAFVGARVVVNAAGPPGELGDAILLAAFAAGAHYVDLGGEQAVVRALYERHESTARKAGLVALLGAGVDCVLGDLAASWAAAHLCGVDDGGDPVRDAPAPRLADDRPLDEIAVSYVFDQLALSAGSQRALFASLGDRGLVWRRDRWEAARAGDKRRVNAGPALGGERDAIAYPGGDAITVPRHIAVDRVATFVSTTRRAAAARAIRLFARALPLVPRAATALLAPYAAPDTDYGKTQLAVVTQARRGFDSAQVIARGHDLYATTAAIAAWIAHRLVERAAGPSGMRAPSELFRGESALREIASIAGLTIEPSFGPI